MKKQSIGLAVLLLYLLIGLGFGLIEGRFMPGYRAFDNPIFAMSLLFFLLSMFLWVAVPITGLILLVWILIKKKSIKKYGHIFLILICLLLISFVHIKVMQYVSDYYEDKNEKIGQEIIDAVAKYEIENGELPSDLDDIQPKYIKQIPKTAWNGEFRYRTPVYQNDSDNYELRGGVGAGWYFFEYYSKSNSWIVAD